MHPIEIPADDLAHIEELGENPIYRFEELLNETNRNDLEMILRGYLELDVSGDDIGDYEVKDDGIILYVDEDE